MSGSFLILFFYAGHVWFRLQFAQAWAVELQAVAVVHKTVEDGVSEGRFTDNVVPCFDWKLAGDQRRATTMAVIGDLHQVAALAGAETVRPPVVEDQEIAPDELPEQTREAAVTVCQIQLGEQPRRTFVNDAVSVAAGLLTKR